MFQVKKRDGSLQDFDRSKITGGVIKSGATPEQAEAVAVEIEGWLPTAAVENVVNSMDIRAKVVEVLKLINSVAGVTYEAYQKTAIV